MLHCYIPTATHITTDQTEPESFSVPAYLNVRTYNDTSIHGKHGKQNNVTY